jgi:hypothetical protein
VGRVRRCESSSLRGARLEGPAPLRLSATRATLKPLGCHNSMTQAGSVGLSTVASLPAQGVCLMTNVDLAFIATAIVGVIVLTSAAAALVIH